MSPRAFSAVTTVLLFLLPALLYANESPCSVTRLQQAMQSPDLEISARCRNHTLFYVQEFHRGEPWALKMFDSSAKPQSGVLTGGLTVLGFYSECLGALPRMPVAHETEVRKEQPPFVSQYCLVTVGLPFQDAKPLPANNIPGFLWDEIQGKKLRFGICTPSTCSEEDVNNIGIQLLRQVGATKNATYSTCSTGKKEYVSLWTFVVVTFIFLVYATLVAIATAYDMRLRYQSSKTTFDPCGNLDKPGTSSMTLERKKLTDSGEEKRTNRVLLAFSIITNAKKIFNVRASSNDSINAIHGMRALSINIILFGHTFYYVKLSMVTRNADDLDASANSVAGQVTRQLTLAVDTFFFLTGFLVVLLTLKRMEESNGKVNWWIFYLHRYWRLTPVVAFATLFYVVYLPYCGDGPLWGSVLPDHYACKAKWWANMLYVQNFAPSNEICVPQTWYVAADIQLYLISPPIIYALYRKPRVGFVVMGVLFTLSTAYVVIVVVLKEYPIVLPPTTPLDVLMNYHYYLYATPPVHVGPYLVGMITGYVVHTRRGLIVMRMRYVCGGWIACASLTVGLILALGLPPAKEVNVPLYASALYTAFSRSIWAVCLAWLLVCCIEGYGGPVNALLSSKFLVPLSRLTFVVYLVHTVPMLVFFGTRQHSFDFSLSLLYFLYIGFMAAAYLLSLVVSLLLEAPIFNVEKLLLAGRM